MDDLYSLRGFSYGVDPPYIASVNISYNIQPTAELLTTLVNEKGVEITKKILEDIGEVVVPALSEEEIDQIINERIGI
jgi:hypothetical protein